MTDLPMTDLPMAEIDRIVDLIVTEPWKRAEATAAIAQLIRQQLAVSRLKNKIGGLDIQCKAGQCSHCDAKRPVLLKLQAELAAEMSPKKSEGVGEPE